MNPRREYETIVTLTATEPMDRKQLEEHMFEVLEVVEEHASDFALGPVVAGNFAEHQIELAYTVMANEQSEAHARSDEVIEKIGRHAKRVRFGRTDTRTREPEVAAVHSLC